MVEAKDRNLVTWDLVSIEAGNDKLIDTYMIYILEEGSKMSRATSVVFQI